MAFSGHADLTFAGIGASGDLRGYAGPKAFNIEGDGSVQVWGHGLSGTALISSKGMSACGKLKLLFKSFTFGLRVSVGRVAARRRDRAVTSASSAFRRCSSGTWMSRGRPRS